MKFNNKKKINSRFGIFNLIRKSIYKKYEYRLFFKIVNNKKQIVTSLVLIQIIKCAQKQNKTTAKIKRFVTILPKKSFIYEHNCKKLFFLIQLNVS